MADIQPEETIKSETVFSGHLIHVRTDTVRLPGGDTTEREIVAHAQTVAILPLLPDGRVVMVRQYRKAAERTLLELPAGGIDGEETPEEAAAREMVEETGYRVGSLERVCAFFTSPGFTTEYMYLLLATDLREGEPTEETDQIEVEPMTVDEALSRTASGEVADSKTILGLLYAKHGM